MFFCGLFRKDRRNETAQRTADQRYERVVAGLQ